MAETLPNHPFMLHADLLHTSFALIAPWFLPRTVVADSRIRTALSADHQVFLCLYFLVFEEFLDNAAGYA